MPNNEEPKSLDQMHPSKNVQNSGKKPMSLAERNMQAAIERAEEREAEAKAAEAEAEAERKNDGRKYDLEVEGFNIGDSLVRRMEYLNERAAETQEQIAEEDIEAEIDEAVDEIDSDESDFDEVDEDVDDIEQDLEDDDEFNFDDEEDAVDGVEPEQPAKETTPNEEVDRAKKAMEGIAKTAAPAEKDDDIVAEKLSDKPLPEQNETFIDEEDIDDLDLEEATTDTDDEDAGVSEQEMEDLRNQIRSKNSGNLPSADKIKIVDKPVSVNQLLAADNTKQKAADWPMMNAGVCVSMSRFSGPEIEALNQTVSGRNRFNTMKDIYRSLYNHIVSEKPAFETWLKETSFIDIEHLFMAAYKASFNGANYIPLNCEHCEHVFLTEDVNIEESMVKFKNDEAKKRFYDILNSAGTVTAKDRTKFIVLSDTVAVTLRDPSIYNTIFENSVLDQNFIDKYEKLLTMMVYIDKIFLIRNGAAMPVKLKEDKHSLAKTCKYRIATYAKVINALPSDAYSTLLAEIAIMNDADDEVKYQFPEVTCPKCGETIEAAEETAQRLLFNRHRLNLLTAQ
mgnify:CR=1 FL=1